MTHEKKLKIAFETLSKINKKWSQVSALPNSHPLKIKVKTQKEQFKELIKKLEMTKVVEPKQLLLPFERTFTQVENAEFKIDKRCTTKFSKTGELIQSGPPCDEEYLSLPDSVEKEYK